MQLQRGGRLGSRPTYAAPWILVRKSRLHENSDLRSKQLRVHPYILRDDSERVKVREHRGHSPKPTVPPLCGSMYRTR